MWAQFIASMTCLFNFVAFIDEKRFFRVRKLCKSVTQKSEWNFSYKAATSASQIAFTWKTNFWTEFGSTMRPSSGVLLKERLANGGKSMLRAGKFRWKRNRALQKKSGEDKTKPNHNLRQYLERKRCGEGWRGQARPSTLNFHFIGNIPRSTEHGARSLLAFSFYRLRPPLSSYVKKKLLRHESKNTASFLAEIQDNQIERRENTRKADENEEKSFAPRDLTASLRVLLHPPRSMMQGTEKIIFLCVMTGFY